MHTTCVSFPSHKKWDVLIGKQRHKLPKVIPSLSPTTVCFHSCISITIYTQRIIQMPTNSRLINLLLKPHHNHFTALFPGPPEWAGARRELLDLMVQGKINRGRHTDHPAGHHSIRTKQCPPPPSPHFLQAGCPSCCPTNSVKALKATSAFGLGRGC